MDGGVGMYVDPASGLMCDDDDAVLYTIEYKTAASRVEIVDTHDHFTRQFVEVEIVAVSNKLRS